MIAAYKAGMRAFAVGLSALVLVLMVPRPGAAEQVTIPAFGSIPAVPGDLERPSGAGPFPAVLILAGCDGVAALEGQTATALAAQGYVALSIDTLAPLNTPNVCADGGPAIAPAVRMAFVSLGWLARQPYVVGDHLGVIGYSLGAIEVLSLVDPLTPHAPPAGLRAAVAYYPDCDRRSPNVTVPLQILDGSADDWAPAPPCQALAQSATSAGNTVKITTYPGATHAFNTGSGAGQRIAFGHLMRYDADATRDAAAKANAFFATYLKAP